MTDITGPPASAIRNLPITAELRSLLDAAGKVAALNSIFITSGGQVAKGEGTRRTGSTRHDRGRAADVQLFISGVAQTFSDVAASPPVKAFVTAAAARGATGIGAGVGYMGNRTIHVGFGTSVEDKARLTWGAGGRSVNAPGWLREAAEAGWSSFADGATNASTMSHFGRYAVLARSGLKLRGGPGINFASERTLPLGTELDVLAFDSADPAWAQVDLEMDGVADGYVFASFLASIAPRTDSESADEADPA